MDRVAFYDPAAGKRRHVRAVRDLRHAARIQVRHAKDDQTDRLCRIRHVCGAHQAGKLDLYSVCAYHPEFGCNVRRIQRHFDPADPRFHIGGFSQTSVGDVCV